MFKHIINMNNTNETNPDKQRQYLINLLNRIPKSEMQLQSKCAELLYFFYPVHWKRLVCVYNNSLKANIQGFGQVPGVSDMYWLAEKGRTIYIEFKFGPKQRISEAQKEWHELCYQLGHTYVICDNEIFFWQIINFTQPCEADIDNLKWLK